MSEKRQFTVHPQIIYSLIDSQAGSLAKGLGELIMNSIDAGAISIDITLTDKNFTVADDGKGFSVIEEIEQFFEVFGFPHDENDHRVYGKFGMGRAQVMAFATTKWRTAAFEMDVDIKNKGLDYSLKRDLHHHDGVTVSGELYEPMLPSDLDATQRELTDLVRYAQIPVRLNGKQISVDPAKEKWDVITDDAYIRLRATGDLKVYNLGVLVRGYPAYQFGTAGVVVARSQLQVNFARNDVLVSKCPLWRRIRRYLRDDANDRNTRKARLSDYERQYLINQFKLGEISYKSACDLKLITDTTGRNWQLSKLDNLGQQLPLTLSPEAGSRIADSIHQRRLAFVLHPKTIDAFGVNDVGTLLELLQICVRRDYPQNNWSYKPKVVEFNSLRLLMDDGYEVLNDRDLTVDERIVLSSIRSTEHLILRGVNLHLEDGIGYREIRAGVSDCANGWTDGSNLIVIERSQLKLAKKGYHGFFALATLLVHEFLHRESDTGSHEHDAEFYNLFHDIVSDSRNLSIGSAAHGMFGEYLKRLDKNEKRKTKVLLSQADREARLVQA